MIPKIIHYCWFGGKPMPELAKKCIDSWKKFCPDYEIKRWAESNFDLNYNYYVREAYDAKKWAFVTDVVRLYVLVHYGGIYMDTDVEVLKPIDSFLKYEAFSGFESQTEISTGIMASEKNQVLFMELLNDYTDEHFLNDDGTYNTTTNVIRITNSLLKYGLIPNNKFQTVRGFTLFPKNYFCPKDYKTRKIKLTKNTFTIHHFDGSWMSDEKRLANELQIKYQKYLPASIAHYYAEFIAVKRIYGFKSGTLEVIHWIYNKLNKR